MGKYIITSLLFFLLQVGYSQLDLDSMYTYDQLQELLKDARVKYTKESEETKEYERQLADIYYLLAQYHESKFNNRKAFDEYTTSLQYYKLIGDSLKVNVINRAIADRYRKAGLYQEADDLFNEILEYYKSTGDNLMQARIYMDLADLYEERGDLEKEQFYINNAIKTHAEIKDTSILLQFMMKKVGNYERLNEVDSALNLASRVFTISNKIDDDEKIAESLYAIGRLNQIKLNYERAIRYLEEGLQALGSLPYDDRRLKFYRSLSEVYSRINDYQMAFIYGASYTSLHDSIMEKDLEVALENAEIKHNVEQQKKDIAILELEKLSSIEQNRNQERALYIMAVGLTLLLLLIYYLVRFYTQKIKTEKIITSQIEEINTQKIRELEDDIKINNMQSMIEGQEIERERIAQDLHDSLGGLLSTIKLQFDSVGFKNNGIGNIKAYQKANELLDTAVTEVRSISHNLQPSALMNLGLIPAIKDLINRFDGDKYPEIDFQHYGLPEKFENRVALSIYRIVQELFNNAIKHSNATEILLQINRVEDEIIIQFEDDGVGFDIRKLNRKGMGLSNIESRINYIKGEMEIDSKPGEGTSYLIHFKYK